QIQQGAVGIAVSGSGTVTGHPQVSVPSVVNQLSQPQHHLGTTTFQPLNGPMSFDGTELHNHNTATAGSGNLSNEPLSLMKGHSDDPGVTQSITSQQTQQQAEDSTLHTGQSDATVSTHDIVNTVQQQQQQSGLQQLSSHEGAADTLGHLEHQENILGLDADEDYTDSPSQRKKRIREAKGKPKKLIGVSKRGNYASYSPELRAEIGKYAAEHGNLAAVQHFKELLGFEIPESTVRGLKDKYLIKRVRGKKEVVSIGFAQRGRPMRLGKYDEIVQDCIRELVKEGEKVSSFLAIATAKQVLMQYEPSLLEEYGGPVKLNPTWAKSFLKRIGLHQLA
ncbi:unnamed protein product, partial [Meganyctiphanes norvegica]